MAIVKEFTKMTINAETVRKIRALRAFGMKLRELADQYGLSISSVSLICANKRWKSRSKRKAAP